MSFAERRLPIGKARKLLIEIGREDLLQKAVDTANQKYLEKPYLLSGKSGRTLLAGLIYTLLKSDRNGMPLISQREVAEAFGCTEVSVRKSHRLWAGILGSK